MMVFKSGKRGLYSTRFQIDREIYVRATKTTNKQLALKIAEQIRNDIVKDLSLPGGKSKTISILDAMKNYTDSKIGNANHKQLVYRINQVCLIVDATKSIELLDTGMVDEIISHRRKEGKSNATLKQMVNFLRGTIELAKRKYRVAPDVEYPSIKISKGRLNFWTTEQERALIDALDPNRKWAKFGQLHPDQKNAMVKNQDFATAMFDVGSRYKELLMLEWKDVDFNKKTIVLWRTKTQTGTTLAMTDRLHSILRRRKDDPATHSQYVFATVSQSRPAVTTVNAIKKAMKRSGIEGLAPTHSARHTVASRLAQNGFSLQEIGVQLGHSSINSTSQYAHLVKSDVVSRAAEVLNKVNNGGV